MSVNKKVENKKMTIVVNSCDKYSDLWYPFFKLFSINANGLEKYDIVLNTENKKYTFDGLNITCPNNYFELGESVPWGRRLKNTLNKVNTPYVLVLLDDFFIREPVNVKQIQQCINWLDNDQKIAAFYLEGYVEKISQKSRYCGFKEVSLNAEYRCNAQAGIWRKDILYKSLIYNESPWEWEIYGTERNKIILKNYNFYALEDNFLPAINYGYRCSAHGWGVYRGKWVKEDVFNLFKKYNIKIDFSIRGYFKEPKMQNFNYKIDKKINLIKKIKNKIKIFYNRIFNKRAYLGDSKYECYVLPLKYFNKGKNWDEINYKELK